MPLGVKDRTPDLPRQHRVVRKPKEMFQDSTGSTWETLDRGEALQHSQ